MRIYLWPFLEKSQTKRTTNKSTISIVRLLTIEISNKSKTFSNSIVIILLASCLPTSLFSQDLIVLKNADEIKSKVVEITDISVKYRKWENMNGPIYNLNLREVLFIRYENGTKEVINQEPTETTAIKPTSTKVVTDKTESIEHKKKRSWLRLSWEFANLSYFGSNITSLGVNNIKFISDFGYNNRMDIGIRLYEKNNVESGININPINFSIHQTADPYDYAFALSDELKYITGNYWDIDYVSTDGTPYTIAASIGIYFKKKLEKSELNFSLNGGILSFQGRYGVKNGRIVGRYQPNDFVSYSSVYSADNSLFINPKISILLGKTNKNVKWSLNADYRLVWLKTRPNSSWVQGSIDGNFFTEFLYDFPSDRSISNILNIGIGISGF
jgi:hypothetical protein